MTKTDIYIDRKISKNISVEKSEQSSDKSETGSDIVPSQWTFIYRKIYLKHYLFKKNPSKKPAHNSTGFQID